MPRTVGTADLPKAKLNKENFRQGLSIFKYLRPYKYQFLAGLLFVGLSAGSTMAFPYLLGELIQSAQQISQGKTPKFSPGSIAILMMVLLTLQMSFSFMRIYLFTSVGENAVADLRKDIYRRLIVMPMDFFAQRRVGELSSRITTDTAQIQDAVTVMLAEILRGILTLIIGISLILFISVRLTLVMLSVIPFIIVIALIFSKTIRRYAREAQDQLANSGTVVQETLQSISNVKAFNNEWYEVNRYSKTVNNVVKLAIKNGRFRGMFVSFLLFSVFGAIVLVAWYAMKINMDFGDLTRFVVFTAFVGGTLAGFADIYSQLQKALGATQRVRELLLEPTEHLEIEKKDLNKEFTLKGEVRFENVRFAYPGRPELQVLKDINIKVQAGQQIAIVGPSGAGKSTIVSLLLRFYEPQSGQILFDGLPATEIPLNQLRGQMALVPQDVLLFGGTIYENIGYGKPDATREEVEAAARKANAAEFIQRFPEGYDTVVGERGVKLSGGQRQRIAIARAILKDPTILILDEATSSLDSESESLVQDALYNLMKNRTSFVIAHRLSTIRNADQILVLEHGEIKERGTHSELLQVENGLYKSLNKLQFAN
ncbi:MAG TPA: ABC transporter transmembrane domain-containing protein [Flavipsychrobacter sp.]|nr:ABC transporter transmembrane domain-containing protein [Flavipsychrobacter sp.]